MNFVYAYITLNSDKFKGDSKKYIYFTIPKYNQPTIKNMNYGTLTSSLH